MIPSSLSIAFSGAILATTAAPARVEPFDEGTLANLVWERAPEVVTARQELIESEAVRNRAHLLPNPTVGATWATITIGRRNPQGLAFSDIPN